MENQFSNQQLNDLKKTYETFKSKTDDHMKMENLKPALQSVGYNPTDEDLEEFYQLARRFGETSIDFPEFITFASRLLSSTDEEEIKEAFRVFDKDGNGYITKYELRHVMLNLGEKLTDEEVDEMIAEADVDGDGKISYNGHF